MQESLLQFIWEHTLYETRELRTLDGEPLLVMHPGLLNRNSGPDFSMARIRIGELIFIGQVELHVRSSDWRRHGHDGDPSYARAILHVVFEHDTQESPGGLPLLVLKGRISEEVFERYSQLIQTTAVLPCSGFLSKTSHQERRRWLTFLLSERWSQKLGLWNTELQRAGGDWHTLFFRRLAAAFGFKVNAEAFLQLAQSLSWSVVERQTNLFQLEALLFGQSGLLRGIFTDDYPNKLKEEYQYQQRKFGLQPLEPGVWKFMRMRPANFPTIRIAQFAALLYHSNHLISALDAAVNPKSIFESLNVCASNYWDLHYRFDEVQPKAVKKALGADSMHHLIINTVAPLKYLYALTQGRSDQADDALRLLDALPPEDNQIIRLWSAEGWPPLHAGISQALIQLFNNYCSRKRCLECAIGKEIMES